MKTKQYNSQQAMQPGKGQGAENPENVNFSEFTQSLPEEFRAEIEEALAALLNYIHSDAGTTAIIQELQQDGQQDIAKTVGSLALKSMDMADGEHGWSDSAKVFAGYFAVTEICLIAREAKIANIPQEQEGQIFQQAAQNYLHSMIKSKPTQEERDKEAIRIQREIDPIMKMQQQQQGDQGGLLE